MSSLTLVILCALMLGSQGSPLGDHEDDSNRIKIQNKIVEKTKSLVDNIETKWDNVRSKLEESLVDEKVNLHKPDEAEDSDSGSSSKSVDTDGKSADSSSKSDDDEPKPSGRWHFIHALVIRKQTGGAKDGTIYPESMTKCMQRWMRSMHNVSPWRLFLFGTTIGAVLLCIVLICCRCCARPRHVRAPPGYKLMAEAEMGNPSLVHPTKSDKPWSAGHFM